MHQNALQGNDAQLSEHTSCPAVFPGRLVEPCPHIAPLAVLSSMPVLLEVLIGDLIVVLHHLAWLAPVEGTQISVDVPTTKTQLQYAYTAQ